MPPLNQSRSGGFGYRSLSHLAAVAAALCAWRGALVIALVVFVNYETNDVSLIARVTSPKAIAEQNREDRILVRQQQAPHVVKLKAGESHR